MQGKALIDQILKSYSAGFHAHVLQGLQVVSAAPRSIRLQMPVLEHHLNVYGTLHGGMSATLIDIGGSAAICQVLQGSQSGVSTDMNVSMHSAAKLGETLEISSFCERVGRYLAFTRTEIRVKDRLIASGSHTKFVYNAKDTLAKI